MTTDNHRQPITDQIFDRQSVADQLQTSRQPIANHSPIGRRVNFGSSLKFENQSATGCHKINDWLATIRRSVADHSALGEQRLDKFMHTNLKRLLWAWQSQGIIIIANEESNCILLICNSDHPFDCQARITALFYHGRITNGHSSLP